MKTKKRGIVTFESSEEKTMKKNFYNLYKKCPIPEDEFLDNMGLFLNSKALSRIFFMNEIYKKIVDIQGIVIEFGTRWGQNIALFSSFRGIYEPFNRHRKIVGFDTFSGFLETSDKDSNLAGFTKGEYSVTKDYERYLEEVMDYHEKANPLPHIKKYEVRKGDAAVEIDKYLKENPQTIIALAYFDMDLYSPTKKCLETIREYLTKGSVVAFDELNDPACPGETIALKSVFGLDKFSIKRSPITSRCSYLVVGNR